MNSKAVKTIVLGGGCFWCTEAVFKSLKGVISVTPGYSGGTTPYPTYEEVITGTTNHAEVIKVEYDTRIIPTRDLMDIFFHTHNPTTLNRQGNDIGTQYRSIIFYTEEKQAITAQRLITVYNSIHEFGDSPVVTQIEPLSTFQEAENYHKEFYQNNQFIPYCQVVITPKLAKLREKYTRYIRDV